MNATCCSPASAEKSASTTASAAAPGTTAPRVGVTESYRKPVYEVTGNTDAYEVRVEMPGVPKGNVKIDLEEDVLSIRGERQSSLPEGWKPLHRELSTVGYQLRLRLNMPVDEDKLTAALENGVLTLKLPVKEAAKPRRIEVQ